MNVPEALPRLSVVIATYNRPQLLGQALRTVLAQDYPKELYEVLVVDNNSPPLTRSVVESFAGCKPSPRWIPEPKQGVSNARNTGIREAKGEIIVFADDDILAEPNWLRKLVEPFLQERRVGGVGGAVIPTFPEGCPSWWRYTHPLKLSESAISLAPEEERRLMSANLAVLRAALDTVGGFCTELGRCGTSLADGEDQDLLVRVRAAGYEIWFSGEAIVQHQFPRSRLTLRYACRNAYDSARTRVLRTTQNPSVSRWTISRYLLTRFLGNGLVLPVWLLTAGACALCGRTGAAKRALVRLCRSLGYVTQSLAVAFQLKERL